MKLALAITFVLASVLSFHPAKAAPNEGVFRKDSNLPLELQTKVVQAVRSECSRGIYDLSEDMTSMKEIRIDQGVSDLYFTTWMKGSILFDGVHPEGLDIRVKSAKYAISNPSVENSEVLEVSSYSSYCSVIIK